MTNVRYMVISILIRLLGAAAALQQPGLASRGGVGNRAQRDVSCRDNLEYPHGNICCLNCPAGTHVNSPCTTAGQRGKCKECDYGAFTEHANGLHQCLKCASCRPDQEIVRQCTSTKDTECQCRSGWFCIPDQACEVCKKCSRCGEDEVEVRNCTAISNTACKKRQPTSASPPVAAVIVPVALIAVAISGAIVYAFLHRRRRQRPADYESSQPSMLKEELDYRASGSSEERQNRENHRGLHTHLFQCPQGVRASSSASTEDERTELWDSKASSASNSQYSLAGPASPPFPTASPRSSPALPRQFRYNELPKLVPVKGEESLRKCFQYFEEIDVDYYKRFFRHLGLQDNLIKSKEYLHHEDKIHELLNIWLERVGQEASLNDLLKALLALNQRLTAEKIIVNATDSGHYVRETE